MRILRPIIRLSLIAVLAFLTTACLTIEEEYKFARNGSGNMSYLIDMSELGSLIQMAGEEEDNPLEQDDSPLADLGERLRGLRGIHDIEDLSRQDDFIFQVRFAFDDIDALNNALNALKNQGEEGSAAPEFFEFVRRDGKQFYIESRAGNGLDMSSMLGEAEGEEAEMAVSMLGNMKFRQKFRFKKPVRVAYTGADLDFTDKKQRAFTLESNFRELAEDPDRLKVTVITK